MKFSGKIIHGKIKLVLTLAMVTALIYTLLKIRLTSYLDLVFFIVALIIIELVSTYLSRGSLHFLYNEENGQMKFRFKYLLWFSSDFTISENDIKSFNNKEFVRGYDYYYIKLHSNKKIDFTANPWVWNNEISDFWKFFYDKMEYTFKSNPSDVDKYARRIFWNSKKALWLTYCTGIIGLTSFILMLINFQEQVVLFAILFVVLVFLSLFMIVNLNNFKYDKSKISKFLIIS
jgi:hypothetical protein